MNFHWWQIGSFSAGRRRRALLILLAVFVSACTGFAESPQPSDPMPSWHERANKRAIVSFVTEATRETGPDYVPPAERIAVFDNDGTLWSEQPLYFQFQFMLDRLKAVAPQHPEWQDNPAFKALVAHDHQALAKLGKKPVFDLIVAAHSGMTTEEYDKTIRTWFATARHPKFGRPYTDLVYEPMQELLSYLRANGFKTFIVSGGTIEFMRPWTEKVYGIPPEQVVGSSQSVRFELRDGKPVLIREPKLDFIDDGPGKPVGIYRNIGRAPVLAVGNSDGDQQMFEYTAAGCCGKRLILLVHHDDAEREYAYDRQSPVGKLDRALNEAEERGWTIVSMKRDWKRVFAFQ